MPNWLQHAIIIVLISAAAAAISTFRSYYIEPAGTVAAFAAYHHMEQA
jgi:hypothetical protein